MALSLQPKHLKRYKDLLRLLLKYGDSSLVQNAGLDASLLMEDDEELDVDGGKPEELAKDLEALGPTFVKLGQMLSTRPDLLPMPYLEALARLQDSVAPFPYEEAEAIVTSELGVRLSKAFAVFDDVPLAAASLGQVYRAQLRDGRPVAVKVQRPGIRQIVLEDLEALGEVAAFVDAHTEMGRRYGFSDMLAEFRKAILRELDYRQEAQNLVTLGQNLKDYDQIVVPQPVDDYTTARVLTMDYVQGTKVTALTPLARLEVDGEALADVLLKAYLDQILVDGFFHADPHPGNVFITDDHRIALIDLGMVARIDPRVQEQLLKLLLAVVEGQGHEVADLSLRLGTPAEDFDGERFRREVADLVGRFQSAPAERVEVGRILIEITRVSGECGIRPAPELTMLGKTQLNLDEVGHTLAPDFDPQAAIRRHAESLMRRRMLRDLSPSHLFASALEMNELMRAWPSRVNTLLRTLTEGDFSLKIDAIDELRLLDNLHTISNRLSVSIVLGALILGAALMMRVETSFTILGYPGLAMLLFLMAAACGFALVFSILMKHEHKRGPGR